MPARANKSRLRGLLLAAVVVLMSTVVHAAEKTTYFHFDALGSPVAATDQAGNVVWKEEYRPYGARIKQEPAAGSNTRWYTGHPQDDDTGLTYMGARYYDPVVGRFMATDPKGFTADNLHSFNRYAYANNNPYKFIDPDGEAAFLAAIPWILSVISAGATGVEIGSGIYDVASGDKSVGQVASERAPGLALSAVPGLGALKLAKPFINVGKGATQGHHTIPKAIQKRLPPDVRSHPDVRGRRGNPNIKQIPTKKHKKIHSGRGRGGDYNRRFDEEIRNRGGYQDASPRDLNDIRDQLGKEFGL